MFSSHGDYFGHCVTFVQALCVFPGSFQSQWQSHESSHTYNRTHISKQKGPALCTDANVNFPVLCCSTQRCPFHPVSCSFAQRNILWTLFAVSWHNAFGLCCKYSTSIIRVVASCLPKNTEEWMTRCGSKCSVSVALWPNNFSFWRVKAPFFPQIRSSILFRWFEVGCTIWAKSVRAKSKHL